MIERPNTERSHFCSPAPLPPTSVPDCEPRHGDSVLRFGESDPARFRASRRMKKGSPTGGVRTPRGAPRCDACGFLVCAAGPRQESENRSIGAKDRRTYPEMRM